MELSKKARSLFRIRRHRIFIIICAVVAVLFFAAVQLMTYHAATTEMPVHQGVLALKDGDRLEQNLVGVGGVLQSVNIAFSQPEEKPSGEVTISLHDGDTLIHTWTKQAEALAWDTTKTFDFSKEVVSTETSAYSLIIEADLTTEGEIFIQTSSQTQFGTCSVNGQAVDAESILYTVTYTNDVSRWVNLFHVVMLFMLGAVLVAVAFILLYTNIKKEALFALLVFVLGSFFAVCITPSSSPDEPHHYHSAYELSNYMMFRGDTAGYGNSHDFDFQDLPGHQNTANGYARILSQIGRAAPEGGEQIEIPSNRSLAYFVQYLPQATALTIGRLLGRNLVTNYLLARLFNLLFYTACVYVAIKRLPKFKVPFGLIAILPMTLHQAGSLSYDVFVNGMSLMLLSAILRLVFTDERVTWKDLVFIGIVAALLAPAKAVYCPLLLLLFLVKKEQFGSMKRKLISIGSIVLACVLLVLLIQLPTIMEMGHRGELKLNYVGEYNYTFSYALQHPIDTAVIFIRSLYQYGFLWCEQAVGCVMSGMNLPIPAWLTTACMFVLFAAILNNPKHTLTLKNKERALLGAIIICITGLIVASMFVAWTSSGSPTVEGVQGRYFTPLLPLVLLVFTNSKFTLTKNMDRELIFTSVFLSVSSISTVLEYTVVH